MRCGIIRFWVLRAVGAPVISIVLLTRNTLTGAGHSRVVVHGQRASPPRRSAAEVR